MFNLKEKLMLNMTDIIGGITVGAIAAGIVFVPIFILLLSSEYRVNIEVGGGVGGGGGGAIYGAFIGVFFGGGVGWLGIFVGGFLGGIIGGIIMGIRGLPALEFPPPGWA